MNEVWALGYLTNFLMGMVDNVHSSEIETFIEAVEEAVIALTRVVMEDYGDTFSENTKELYNKIMEVYKARENLSEWENNWTS